MNTAFRKFFSEEPQASGDSTESVPSTEPVRYRGRIIKVSDKGWGFISCKEIKFTRIFFHWTSLRQDTLNFTALRNGMTVEFTAIEIEGKGTRAIKIKVITEEPVQELTPEEREAAETTE